VTFVSQASAISESDRPISRGQAMLGAMKIDTLVEEVGVVIGLPCTKYVLLLRCRPYLRYLLVDVKTRLATLRIKTTSIPSSRFLIASESAIIAATG